MDDVGFKWFCFLFFSRIRIFVEWGVDSDKMLDMFNGGVWFKLECSFGRFVGLYRNFVFGMVEK